jgi:hypothetical protein
VKMVKEEFLEVIQDPGRSMIYLQNALVDEESAAKYDREPFPTVLKRFLENFPGGFKGERYLSEERNYKMVAVRWAEEHLNKERWESYLKAGDFEELSQEIRRFYGKLNLLASFEVIKVNAALKNREAQKVLCISLFELLYGEGSIKSRFDATKSVLERFDLAKWPIITYPLFILFPKEHMFIKPEMTREAAATRGFDIQYDSELNWNTYNRVVMLAIDLRDRLIASDNADLHPVDMVDIQGFMWCIFTKSC